jgi:RNA polymerase sigma-70 factor (ECF subfamily)
MASVLTCRRLKKGADPLSTGSRFRKGNAKKPPRTKGSDPFFSPKTMSCQSHVADPDVELMLRVQRDEPGAFAELSHRFGTRIFARLFRTLHDRQEAEDLTQDVFLRLYRSRQRYRPRAKFSTWLFHITQNVVRNALRRRRRHAWLRFGPLEGDDERYPERCRRDPLHESPSAAIERRELAQAVRGAMAGLGCRQRTALEMHQFQHCSYAEIAAALALTPEATKSLLYRARLQLRGHLDALE